jgi:hypothetical protein
MPRKARDLYTQSELKDLFDFKDGFLIRKNGKRAASLKTAGTKTCKKKYWFIQINKKAFYCHRLIWIWNYGDIPEGYEIDHIDGDGLNNSLDNLRLANRSQNLQNRIFNGKYSRGVYSNKNGYSVQIGINGKKLYVGYYKTLEEAIEARKEAEKKHHPSFGISNREPVKS